VIPLCVQAQQKQDYSGIVLDSLTKETIAYATVTLIDTSNNNIAVGITDSNGRFKLTSPVVPNKVKISFVNYKTIERDISVKSEAFYLVRDTLVLDDVDVSSGIIRHKIDNTTYIVTAKMREGTATVQEMLDKIHGLRFDKIANTILVDNKSSVLLLINGLNQSQDYIKNLSPDKISKVEIIKSPVGRYLSENYTAIINLILKKDYNGYDIHIRNFTIINPVGTNAGDWAANEQPGITFSYTRNKFNVFSNYIYGRSRWNSPVSIKKSYTDVLDMESQQTTTANPNQSYKYHANIAAIGANYQIANNHTLSTQMDFHDENTGDENIFDMTYFYPDNTVENMKNITNNHEIEDNYTGTVYYLGKINERLNINSDFRYTYYTNHIHNQFNKKGNIFAENIYKIDKKSANFNIDLKYTLSKQVSVDVGYKNLWRSYDYNTNSLYYKDNRNNAFVHFTYKPAKNLSFQTGSGVEYIKLYDADNKNDTWKLLPYFMLNYQNDYLNINARYVTHAEYPSLYQMNPLKKTIDEYMVEEGNSNLKPSLIHNIAVEFSLWDLLSITPQIVYTPGNISAVYDKAAPYFIKTYHNTKELEASVEANLELSIGDFFSANLFGGWLYQDIKYQNIKNSYKSLLGGGAIGYFNPNNGVGAQLEYSSMMVKNAIPQGYKMNGLDSWQLTLGKQFKTNKIKLSISYFLPVSFGIRPYQRSEIITPFYKEEEYFDLKSYRNMLFIRMSIRFNKGEIKKTPSKHEIEKEKHESRGLFGN
jgi:hypothetical protein